MARPMTVAKGFLQGMIVLLWTIYVVTQIVSNARDQADRSADPTGGVDLIVEFLETLPLESLVIPTVAMAIGLIGLEVVFVAIRRMGGPRGRRRT